MTRTLFFLLLLSATTAWGQDFGKNATWFREHPYGAFKCFHSGDTVILGKACRKIEHEIYVQPGPPLVQLYNAQDLYLYDTGDTVFVYNNLYGRFTPLYVFNVSEGDTVTLPALPLKGTQILGPQVVDSSWQFVVDSVRDVLYDTTLLKTIYSHTLQFPNRTRPFYEWSYGTGPSAYARKIGGVEFGLLPNCRSCVEILMEGTWLPGNLRCYADDSIAIKLVTDCDAGGVPMAIQDPTELQSVELFPNPASDRLQIKNTGRHKLLRTETTDVTGRVMRVDDLSVVGLPDGFYLVRLYFSSATLTRKVMVRH